MITFGEVLWGVMLRASELLVISFLHLGDSEWNIHFEINHQAGHLNFILKVFFKFD